MEKGKIFVGGGKIFRRRAVAPPPWRRPCLCLFKERMVTARLRWYLEKNNILNKYQSGFRERRRPIDHLINLHDAVYQALGNQRSVLAVFIDTGIKKAFNIVHKNTLILKLLKIGI